MYAPGGTLKKALRPRRKRALVHQLEDAYRVSERRACGALAFNRNSHRYQSQAADQTPLRMRILDIAKARPRFRYERIWAMLRREGWLVNRKRIHRLYREENLQVRTKHRKKRAGQARVPLPVPVRANERWSMDFVADCLDSGRRLRILTIVDQYSRECPAIKADFSLNAAKYTRAGLIFGEGSKQGVANLGVAQ